LTGFPAWLLALIGMALLAFGLAPGFAPSSRLGRWRLG
jgi:hypothetical protein